MTRLIALAGLACIGAFVYLWRPGGFLLLGLALLYLALVRRGNEYRVRRVRRRP